MAGRKFGQGQETPLSWSLAEKEGESYLQRGSRGGFLEGTGMSTLEKGSVTAHIPEEHACDKGQQPHPSVQRGWPVPWPGAHRPVLSGSHT